MPVTGWDHVSFPAGDPEAILDFYKRLGFETIHEEEFRSGKYPVFAIAIGENAKLNFHGPAFWQDPNFDARGPTALPGCGDFCFVFEGTIEEAVELIEKAGAKVAYGPFDQPGGAHRGRRLGTSVYTRDPDGNLVEFMTYPATGRHPVWGSVPGDSKR
jgi:catechol 2,3-dioxygenase-like lactoylglutathione lyase family enzyme